MVKAKNKYSVYLITEFDYCGNGVNGKFVRHIGDTWAVSAKKAECNVSFREDIPVHSTKEMQGDGMITRYLKAVPFGNVLMEEKI